MPHSHQAAVQAFNAGNAAWRNKAWESGVAHYEAAIRLDPQLVSAYLGLARCLIPLNRLPAARDAFAGALRLDAKFYSAWLEAGHLCRQMGELQQALGAYRRAIDAEPERHEAYLGLARVLHYLGQHDAAHQAFIDALDRVPDDTGLPPAQARLAHLVAQYRLEAGDTLGCVQAALIGQRALARTPETAANQELAAELWIDEGEALWRLGRDREAEQILTQASKANSEATLVRLAMLSYRHNRWQEAIAVLRRNLALHPNSPQAHWNLAHILTECWHMEEAEAVLRQAEALGPQPCAPSMRASIAGRQGEVDLALSIYLDTLQRDATQHNLRSSAAMCSLYSDRLSPQAVAELHRQLFAPLARADRPPARFERLPLAGRRLRLGIVSADFHHQHPVNIFMQPILREIDRRQFEVFLYFTGSSYDEQTRLVQQRVEHWIEAATFNDALFAKTVAADRIDVLLDLSGHTGQQRMALFAQRAAPVQATYLGYPGSTGVPNMDWLIGDAIVTPPELDALCSERVARLEHTVFCFAPEADYPYPAYSAADAERPLTFGSFNNAAKLTRRTLGLWAKILAALPQARLLLKSPSFGDGIAIKAFSERLLALGMDLERVEFRGPTGLSDMMQEYADIDIALDPVPYNGGTTSLQAMWMGVPLVCQLGGHFVSRMGASFMTAAGLADWVAEDDDQYVRIAREKAGDRQALLELKRTLRSRLQASPAWDIVAHTRAFERAILHMSQPAIQDDLNDR